MHEMCHFNLNTKLVNKFTIQFLYESPFEYGEKKIIREKNFSELPSHYKYHPLLLLDPLLSLSNSFPNSSSSVSPPKLSSKGFHSAISADTARVMPGDLKYNKLIVTSKNALKLLCFYKRNEFQNPYCGLTTEISICTA